VITLPKEIAEEMIKHAKEEYPRECCGMLAGRNHLITKRFKTKNIAKHIDEYELDPLAQVNTFEEIDRLSLDFLGVYHSHPHHPPYPSELDKLQAFYPDTAFFIISLLNFHQPDINAFRIDKGKVLEEEIIVD
jgi:proteasome lid subunit RPN8/RPN11